MKLQLGLKMILKLHFKIQVRFCTELIHWMVIYRSPGSIKWSSKMLDFEINKIHFSLVLPIQNLIMFQFGPIQSLI